MRALTKMRLGMTRTLLNHRIIFTYCMALSCLSMHYLVSFADFQPSSTPLPSDAPPPDNNNPPRIILFPLNANFNSKRLLNVNQRKPQRRAKPFVATSEPLVIDAPPPPSNLAYNLRNKTAAYFSQIRQDRVLVQLLDSDALRAVNGSRDGLFVEAGAYDGETWSNTLHLEKYRNWSGLLVEPSPENYHKLRHKRRSRAYSANHCLCAGPESLNASYIEAGPFGIAANASSFGGSAGPRVVCHPLAKLIDAFFVGRRRRHRSRISGDGSVQVPVIDYLSLDIEGGERALVETFPWQRYRFNLLNIEYNQDGELYAWLVASMRRHGYVETVVDDVWHQDVYLAHESVVPRLNLSARRVSQFV